MKAPVTGPKATWIVQFWPKLLGKFNFTASNLNLVNTLSRIPYIILDCWMEGITFYMHIKFTTVLYIVNRDANQSTHHWSKRIIRKKPVKEIHILILKISRKDWTIFQINPLTAEKAGAEIKHTCSGSRPAFTLGATTCQLYSRGINLFKPRLDNVLLWGWNKIIYVRCLVPDTSE